MSRKERELKRKKKKRFQIALISFIFLYLFIRSVPSVFGSAFKTILPESINIEDKVIAEGIIIKKENLYKADAEGKVELIINEGERVAAGSRVANLILLNDTSTLNQELEELDKKIEVLSQTEKDSEIIKDDEEKVEENIEETIYELQNSIIQGDYKNTEILKGKISIYSTKQKDITGENTLISQSLDSLKVKQNEIKEQISNNTISYFPGQAGIVSFKIDNFEEIYSFNHKDNFTYSDFKLVSNKEESVENNKNVKVGDPIFKIIDNFKWYMMIKVDDSKTIDGYKEGDSIVLTSKDIEGELKGIIKSIGKEKGKALIQCEFNTDFYDYYDKRFIDVNIIKYKYDGFKIPTKSIVDKDGQKGVYIKDISGIIKFKPVEILKEEDKITYIKSGDKNNEINIKGSDKPLKTVAIFDEILRNTINVKEGMVIN